jgi:acyl carrier protein
VEMCIASLWQELLRRKQVGRFDNFFELGGHSLLAARVAARLEEMFDVKVGVRAVYEYSTLKDIAAHLDKLVAIDSLADDAIENMSEEEMAKLLRDLEALDEN